MVCGIDNAKSALDSHLALRREACFPKCEIHRGFGHSMAIFAVVGILLILSPTAVAAKRGPSCLIDKINVDLGITRLAFPNTPLMHCFLITNVGDEDLLLSNFKVSCKCTKPPAESLIVAPGQTEKVETQIDTSGLFGRRTFELYFETNEKGTQGRTLSITADFVPPIYSLPSRLDFGSLEKVTSPIAKAVSIYVAEDVKFEPKLASTGPFVVKMDAGRPVSNNERLAGYREYRIQVEVSPQTEGAFHGEVTAKFGEKGTIAERITVRGYIAGRFRVSPPFVYLGACSSGKAVDFHTRFRVVAPPVSPGVTQELVVTSDSPAIRIEPTSLILTTEQRESWLEVDGRLSVPSSAKPDLAEEKVHFTISGSDGTVAKTDVLFRYTVLLPD